jgi:GH15 family glucan-1,4-alpha-glucosidase
MYRRSLLVLRACVDRHGGGAVAGARVGWAYVWPRDAGAVAIALASAGYREEARRIAHFLLELKLDAAARFYQAGKPVAGRGAQGDATGWVVAAAKASGLPPASADRGRPAEAHRSRATWRERADYQEKGSGDYLGNAIAAGVGSFRLEEEFGQPHGLVRSADDPDSGLDSAAAWAVRPFPRPALFPMVRRTLLRLVADRGTRFGLLPSQDWDGGEDPWTAPTAWTAWAFAALAQAERGRSRRAEGDRRAALGLMADLRRAATPLGLLPERVDAETGFPASTTPLAWSHAFAILAIRELWPGPSEPSG